MTQTPDKASLYEWLDSTIDELPFTGQIVLNLDGNTIKWEVKSAHESSDRNGDHERVEVRRFGRLSISRRYRHVDAVIA